MTLAWELPFVAPIVSVWNNSPVNDFLSPCRHSTQSEVPEPVCSLSWVCIVEVLPKIFQSFCAGTEIHKPSPGRETLVRRRNGEFIVYGFAN